MRLCMLAIKYVTFSAWKIFVDCKQGRKVAKTAKWNQRYIVCI